MATEGYLLDDEEEYLAAEEIPRPPDRRAELMLGALVVAVVGLLVAMIVFVFVRGWPSFAHNGLSWFSADGSVDNQLQNIFQSGETPGAAPDYTLHAWPLIWSTMLVTGISVCFAFVSLAVRLGLHRRVRARVDARTSSSRSSGCWRAFPRSSTA